MQSPRDAARPRASGLDASKIDTEFTRIAPQGYIDLALKVTNPFAVAITLNGTLVAHDAHGSALPNVEVTSAFGIEQGRDVVMPGGEIDILQLRGPQAADVRDVTLENVTVHRATAQAVSEAVDLVKLDGRGREVNYAMTARHVRLTNPNGVQARVRLVLLMLAAPKDGQPQMATQVRDVKTVELPANGSREVLLDAATLSLLRQGFTSFVTIKVVFAP